MKDTQSRLTCNDLFGGACDANRLLREQRPYLFYDFTRSRIPEAIRVNDFPIIDINTELAKPAPYDLYLRVILFPQLGRHTGSHHLLDGSYGTVTNRDFFHGSLSFCRSVGF